MPCVAPYPGWLACPGPVVTGVGGYDVSAQNLCLPHYKMKYGQQAVPLPAAADPATVLLLHGESLADVKGHSLTATGQAGASAVQSKFGGSSLAFDGAGDWITLPDSPDWAFGSGEFTIECWLRFNSVTPVQTFMNQWLVGGNWGWVWQFSGASQTRFDISADGTSLTQATGATWTPVVNQWYHLAIVRSGNNILHFVDGAVVATIGLTPAAQTFFDSAAPLVIGARGDTTNQFNGYMDEVRISKVARWAGNFSVPTAPYT